MLFIKLYFFFFRKRIRLGEYDLLNVTDCVEELGYLDCTEPVQRKEVSEVIVHENFSFGKKNNDIALVRLRYRVRITGTIGYLIYIS